MKGIAAKNFMAIRGGGKREKSFVKEMEEDEGEVVRSRSWGMSFCHASGSGFILIKCGFERGYDRTARGDPPPRG